MSIELFEQSPALFFASLLISLIITVLAYGAFPVIFAKTRKAPITSKKYKWLCYGINFAVMVSFIVLNGEPSNGLPYLFWTWIFSKYGEKTLGLKGVMQDSDYFKKPLNPLVKCKVCGYEGRFDSKCPRCKNSGLFETIALEEKTEEQTAIVTDDLTIESNTNRAHNKRRKAVKVRYCSKCGALINNETKVCSGCGKKYFKGIKFNKFSVLIISSVLIILYLAIMAAYYHIHYQALDQKISTLESTIKNKDTYISQLQEQLRDSRIKTYNLQDELDFYEEYAVCVNENSKKYHTYDCEDFDASSFWIYNTNAAENKGYYACPKCH